MGDYAALLGDAVLLGHIHSLEKATRLKAELARQFQTEVVEDVSAESQTPLVTLVDFTAWIGRQVPETMSDGDVERYAFLIGGAAERLLDQVDQILLRSIDELLADEPDA